MQIASLILNLTHWNIWSVWEKLKNQHRNSWPCSELTSSTRSSVCKMLMVNLTTVIIKQDSFTYTHSAHPSTHSTLRYTAVEEQWFMTALSGVIQKRLFTRSSFLTTLAVPRCSPCYVNKTELIPGRECVPTFTVSCQDRAKTEKKSRKRFSQTVLSKPGKPNTISFLS